MIDVRHRSQKKANIEVELIEIAAWEEAQQKAEDLGRDQGLIIVMADRNLFSYASQMHAVPDYLNRQAVDNNYILIYPFSKERDIAQESRSVNNINDFATIGKLISKVFK